MMRYSNIFLGLVLIFFSLSVRVQAQDNDSIEEMFYIDASYTGQKPFADMATSFGLNSAIGLGLNFKTHKNWTFGLEWNFMFGKHIKQDTLIFENLITENRLFVGKDGDYSNVKLFERGHILTLKAGKIFPINNKNYNSGIHVKLGAGVMQHKIKSIVEFDEVPQLRGEYKKLYDRLTSGIALSQYIGYSHFSNSRLVNFYGGIEIIEAFTKGRRDYQADLQGPYHDARLEILLGAKIGWMIPFRRRLVSEYYFY